MELIVEVVTSPGSGASTDVVFEVEPAATFGDLADALHAVQPLTVPATLRVARTGQTPRRDDRVADVDVRSGDRVVLVDAVNAAFSVTPEAFGATLVVTAPDGAQTEYPLRYGDSTIGRDLDNDVVVKDPQFSRRHARITVTDVITVADLGSKNGVVVGDVAISTPTVLRPGQTMAVGDIDLAIRDHRRAIEAVSSHNRIEFNRPPRVTRPYQGIEVELPAPPEQPRKQRLPWFSALLPVAFGLALVLVVPSFGLLGVAFMLLSPVLLLGSYIEAKRSGKFDFRDAKREHAEVVAEHVARLERERDLEIRSRFHEAPAGGELRGMVHTLSDRLWERAPGDVDFLSLRVGTATLPSRSRVKVASGGARDLRKDVEEIPGRFQLLERRAAVRAVRPGRRRRALRTAAGDPGDGPFPRAAGRHAPQPDRPGRRGAGRRAGRGRLGLPQVAPPRPDPGRRPAGVDLAPRPRPRRAARVGPAGCLRPRRGRR